MNLYEMSIKYSTAFEKMSEADFDPETINDTLEAMEGEIAVKGANVLAYALNLESDARQIKEVIDRLTARNKALENKSEWVKEYLKANMAKTGITEISAIDGTFKAVLRVGRDEGLIVDHEGSIPMDYFELVPESWKLDKTALKKAIKSGLVIEGAHIEKRDRLEIK